MAGMSEKSVFMTRKNYPPLPLLSSSHLTHFSLSLSLLSKYIGKGIRVRACLIVCYAVLCISFSMTLSRHTHIIATLSPFAIFLPLIFPRDLLMPTMMKGQTHAPSIIKLNCVV